MREYGGARSATRPNLQERACSRAQIIVALLLILGERTAKKKKKQPELLSNWITDLWSRAISPQETLQTVPRGNSAVFTDSFLHSISVFLKKRPCKHLTCTLLYLRYHVSPWPAASSPAALLTPRLQQSLFRGEWLSTQLRNEVVTLCRCCCASPANQV